MGESMPREMPTAEQLRRELKRVKHRQGRSRVIRRVLSTLLVAAAVAVVAVSLWMPALQINGSSMTPTLWHGEVILTAKSPDYEPGDIIAFYYNDKILVKRMICGPGTWVDIDEDGTVFLDGEALEEPYVEQKALGECSIALPYRVPDGEYFVMGDHRSTSVDSRNPMVGCVAQEQFVGKLVFRIWPISRIGLVK